MHNFTEIIQLQNRLKDIDNYNKAGWIYNKTVMDFSGVIHDVDIHQKIIIDLGYRLGQ